MAKSQSKSHLKFLHQSDWLDWEDILAASDNVRRLQMKLAAYFRERLYFRDGLFPTKLLSLSFADALIDSVGQKLRRYYPQEEAKDTSTLLRWHPAQAASFLNQAVSYLIDIWMDHQPDCGTLERLGERVLSSLKHWPVKDMRARPEHGETSQGRYLIIFEETMKCLEGLPRRPQNGYEEKQRREFLERRFEQLPPVPGRQGSRFHHPKTGQLFFEVPDSEWDSELTRWTRTLSRKQIALEITVAVVRKTGTPLSVQSLRRLLPKLRAFAARFDRAQ